MGKAIKWKATGSLMVELKEQSELQSSLCWEFESALVGLKH